jgi:hypothetical protein
MSLKQALFNYFEANTAVNNIVKGEFYPGGLDKKAKSPSVILRVPTVQPEKHLKGLTGLYRALVVIEACSKTEGEATTLAEAIAHSGITRVKGVTFGVDIRGVELKEGPEDELPVVAIDGNAEMWGYISTLTFEVVFGKSYSDP